MPYQPAPNVFDRRRVLLTEAITRRVGKLVSEITEPVPYNMQRVDDTTQLRKYLDLEATGQIGQLRRSWGGMIPDEDVDRYVAQMERLKAKMQPAVQMGLPLDATANPEDTAIAIQDLPASAGFGAQGEIAGGTSYGDDVDPTEGEYE